MMVTRGTIDHRGIYRFNKSLFFVFKAKLLSGLLRCYCSFPDQQHGQ
jgi:hypothetical protein